MHKVILKHSNKTHTRSNKCDCLQKPDIFAHVQTEIHFIAPAYIAIATLNSYAFLPPSLANVDWSAFPECSLPTM